MHSDKTNDLVTRKTKYIKYQILLPPLVSDFMLAVADNLIIKKTVPYNPIPGYYLLKFTHESGENRKENQKLGRTVSDLDRDWPDLSQAKNSNPTHKKTDPDLTLKIFFFRHVGLSHYLIKLPIILFRVSIYLNLHTEEGNSEETQDSGHGVSNPCLEKTDPGLIFKKTGSGCDSKLAFK